MPTPSTPAMNNPSTPANVLGGPEGDAAAAALSPSSLAVSLTAERRRADKLECRVRMLNAAVAELTKQLEATQSNLESAHAQLRAMKKAAKGPPGGRRSLDNLPLNSPHGGGSSEASAQRASLAASNNALEAAKAAAAEAKAAFDTLREQSEAAAEKAAVEKREAIEAVREEEAVRRRRVRPTRRL